eukprot:51864-Chlamydomonas_euryale.AAC.1
MRGWRHGRLAAWGAGSTGGWQHARLAAWEAGAMGGWRHTHWRLARLATLPGPFVQGFCCCGAFCASASAAVTPPRHTLPVTPAPPHPPRHTRPKDRVPLLVMVLRPAPRATTNATARHRSNN